MDFKEMSALLAEINEQMSRFKKFVGRLSSVEEIATNLELELSELKQKLMRILSSNGYGRAFPRRSLKFGEKPKDPQDPSVRQSHSPVSPARLSSGLRNEIVEFHNLFQAMGKRYSGLVGRISNVGNSASNLDFALMGILKRLKALIDKGLTPSDVIELLPVPLNTRKIPKRLLDVLISAAEAGVVSLSTKQLSNGRTICEIEGGKFILSAQQADLLMMLAKDPGQSKDDLVGWKSIDEIAQSELGPKRGWPPKDEAALKRMQHTVDQRIHRLRGSLCMAGINPFLIQKNTHLGCRFALRRNHLSEDAIHPL